ncbi:hypothetical protein GCM10008935_19320 [Alkalibacillus silvisoli]|uniref:SWIM-type domain-containing protein n=1 Tax=Alkalibacillus silvisoli TaxID=392823 RepID=A0ABP3JTM9_9BACI
MGEFKRKPCCHGTQGPICPHMARNIQNRLFEDVGKGGVERKVGKRKYHGRDDTIEISIWKEFVARWCTSRFDIYEARLDR